MFGLVLRTSGRCNGPIAMRRIVYFVCFVPLLLVLEYATNFLLISFPIIAQKLLALILYANRYDPKAGLKFYSEKLGFHGCYVACIEVA